MRKISGILFILLCTAFVKWCCLDSSALVKGRVTDIRKVRTSKNGATMDLPIVSFRYGDEFYETKKDIGVTFYSSFKIGDNASVIFPRGEPSDAEVYTFSAFWLSFPTIAITGLICIAWIGICNITAINNHRTYSNLE